jgi:hypothetical protein
MSPETAYRLAGEAVDWNEGGRVHNWRNYIGENTQRLWDTFTREQKAALILDADDLAGNENWD